MIRIYTIAALIALVGLLGWQLKNEIDRSGKLAAENRQVIQQLTAATEANRALGDTIRDLDARYQQTLGRIADTEADKRRLAAELESRNADLRRALRDQPDWATTPVPGSVAAGVNAAIDRVRDTAAHRDYPG